MNKRTIAVLGATGSIGTQALDLVRRYPEQFEVSCLVAHSSAEEAVFPRAGISPEGCRIGGGARVASGRRSLLRMDLRGGLCRARARSGQTDGRAVRDRRHRGIGRGLDGAGRLRARAAGQQGGAGDRRPAGDGEGRAARQADAARGQRALGDLSVPSGAAGQPGPAADPHGVGRRAADVAGRSDPYRHRARCARPPDLAHGRQDHRRLRHDAQQGARGHRGAPPVRHAARENRRGRPPAERHPLHDRIRGRRGARADGAARYARPDRLCDGVSEPPALRRRAARLCATRQAYV